MAGNPFFKNAIRHNVEVDTRPSETPPKPKEQQERVYAPAIDISTKNDESKTYEEKIPEKAKIETSGIAGDHLAEPLPEFIDAPCEVIYQNQNGSFIVLGRDRPGSRLSGYGGKGDTQAASIDIVVGRVGFESAQVNEVNQQLYVDPSFKKDSARIYISQKSDVDDYFGIVDGMVGNVKTQSCIALKADGLRLVAREGMKLVTGTDKFNSLGGAIRSIAGVDLIAGNDDSDMQPIPRGENLANALDRIVTHLDALAGIVDAFLHTQMEYNAKIANHWHTSPFYAMPNLPSQVLVPAGAKCLFDQLSKVERGIVNLKINLAGLKVTYLNSWGKNYILSRYHHLN